MTEQCHCLVGEPQQCHHDDAPAYFQSGAEELPVWDPGGVQTVSAPEEPEGPAALATGQNTHTHTQKVTLMISLVTR